MTLRAGHVSWRTVDPVDNEDDGVNVDAGVLLLGGVYNASTAEMIAEDGSLRRGFPLHRDTANACSIPDPRSGSLVVTGGQFTQHAVSR